MAKKFFSIMPVVLMGLYIFPLHKPHTCFTLEGKRYHGDCMAYKNEGKSNHHHSSQRLFAQKYICFNMIKGNETYELPLQGAVNPGNTGMVNDLYGSLNNSWHLQHFFIFPELRAEPGPLFSNISLRTPPFC